MWAESEEGEGSTFYFTVEVGPEGPAQHTDSLLPAARDELDVILVTDTRRRVVSQGLEGTKLRVIRVKSPDQAPDAVSTEVEERQPHIVVMDFREVGLDGPERTMDVIGNAKAVVLTPAGQRGDAARCRKLGISAYLTGRVASRDVSRAITAMVDGVPALITRHWLREQGLYR